MRTIIRCYYSLLASAILLNLTNCNLNNVINSSWQKIKISIDGNISDWNGLITQTPDQKFGIGVANDDSSVFVCLTTDDPRIIHQVMRSGMTIWFESGRSERNRLGIHFPMGMAGSGINFHAYREAAENSDSIRQMMQEALNTMELLGPGEKDTVPMRTTIAESFGIQMKLFPERDNFIYELKVPLHPNDSTSKYFITANKNSLITIVLESSTPETDGGSTVYAEQHRSGSMEIPGEKQNGLGRGRESFGGGHQHHGGMGAGGYHRSGNHEPAEPFSIKLCVKLANSK